MNDLLRKIYQEVILYEDYSLQLGKTLDEQTMLLLEPYRETFSSDNLETIRTLMYELAYEAEKMGYILGVKSVTQIITELYSKDL